MTLTRAHPTVERISSIQARKLIEPWLEGIHLQNLDAPPTHFLIINKAYFLAVMKDITEFPRAYNSSEKLLKTQRRWIPYLFLGMAINGAIWSSALLLMKVMPRTYTSDWTLTLPGSGSSTNVNLPGLGGAVSEATSPYANQSQDPRETYKFLITSEPVLLAAAEQLNMPKKKFGKPKVAIVTNTTLMTLESTGDSPEEAQKKSLVLYNVFKARLKELRSQEAAQREASVQEALKGAGKKLELAQKRLSDYQFRSGLASNTQIEQLSAQIEELRKARAEIVAQQQQSNARLQQLSTNLNVTTPQASEVLILKADQLFQQSLKDYIESTAKLSVLNAKYLPNHPAIVREQGVQNSAKSALLERSQSLLGHPVEPGALGQINRGDISQNNSTREILFKDLITAQVDRQGFQASAQELEQQIAQLEARLKKMTEYGSTLESLRRDMQISETVFSSTVARLDVNKSDIFGSYPEVQLLTQPSLPDSSKGPQKKLILLGAVASSFFCTNGLILLWLRRRLLSAVMHKFKT
jgi:uncharacterized protein involved in exopolysaccharide biosynthesis